jgi:5-methylcytosine-specific restriction endonuclease McrA
MAVLLLNAGYEPLAVIPYRRAVALLLRDRVEAASAEATILRAAEGALRVPHILRLRRYVHAPRRGVHWSRAGVLRRDRYICIYCGNAPGDRQGPRTLDKRDFTVEHIVPRSRGGRNTWVNTACACNRCNNRKGDRLPHEIGYRLRWEPKIPRVDYLVLSGDVPEVWKIYLELG